MKRHEVLAAIAAAAGLTLATAAHAGLATSMARTAPPAAETMVLLQSQVGENSDEALSRMIHLAKSSGHDRASSKGGNGNHGSKSQGNQRSGNSKSKGGADHKGKGHDGGKGHVSQGHGKGHEKGHGKGHGKGHHHPS